MVDGDPQLGGSSCGCDRELRKSSLSHPVPLNGELCRAVDDGVEWVLVVAVERLRPGAAEKALVSDGAAANSNATSET